MLLAFEFDYGIILTVLDVACLFFDKILTWIFKIQVNRLQMRVAIIKSEKMILVVSY